MWGTARGRRGRGHPAPGHNAFRCPALKNGGERLDRHRRKRGGHRRCGRAMTGEGTGFIVMGLPAALMIGGRGGGFQNQRAVARADHEADTAVGMAHRHEAGGNGIVQRKEKNGNKRKEIAPPLPDL